MLTTIMNEEEVRNNLRNWVDELSCDESLIAKNETLRRQCVQDVVNFIHENPEVSDDDLIERLSAIK